MSEEIPVVGFSPKQVLMILALVAGMGGFDQFSMSKVEERVDRDEDEIVLLYERLSDLNARVAELQYKVENQ